jgi:hypothetical protein
MDIRYKVIEHQVGNKAPFIGAVISAIGTSIKEKNSPDKHLKKLEDKVATEQEIIAEIKSNPANEGIIFCGLEWSDQPLEMVKLIEVAVKNGLRIMIYTGHDIREFHSKIGKGCSGKLSVQHELINQGEMYELIGINILNHYIPDDYYIRAGVVGRQKDYLIKGGFNDAEEATRQ